jgi:hypothetical protein
MLRRNVLAEATRSLAGASRRARIIAWLSAMCGAGAMSAVIRIPPVIAIPIMAWLFALFVVDVLRGLDFDWYLVGIVLAGMVVYVGYLTHTSSTQRNPEAFDQLSYITFIVQNGKLPPPVLCNGCYHAPLYYVLAALWVRLTALTKLASPGLCLQLFSLVISLGFVVFALLIVKRFASHRPAIYLAAALIVFWPYSIMNSIRVHNDVLVGALMTAAIYFMVRWFEDDRANALGWAVVCSSLSVLTKSNGYIVVVSLLVLLVWKNRRASPSAVSGKKTLVILLALAVCAMLGVRKSEHGQRSWCHSILGKACDATTGLQDPPGNSLAHYLYFDIRSYLAEPFINTYRPETGAHYFWNTLLKSSLFGVYSGPPDPQFVSPLNRALAGAMNFLLLGMVLFVLIGAISVTRENLRRHRVLLLSSIVLVVSVAGFWAVIPWAHHADFRLVFPLVVPACLFFAQTVDRCRRQGRQVAHIVGYVLSMPFVLLSIAVFVPH